MPGGGKKSRGKQQPKKKVKGKSGNPAKRAQQEREAMQRALGGGAKKSAPAGSAFGVSGGDDQQSGKDLENLELPGDLGKLLGGGR